ncbi:MAG TPA: hydrogenase 4 subunit F [Rhodopseudomonas sp.]|uniref:hydrogenase 4 subunit F n=1 Tax=Rhodopseudomonas sp. TaxID=1078 RepID=UPI002EDA32B8
MVASDLPPLLLLSPLVAALLIFAMPSSGRSARLIELLHLASLIVVLVLALTTVGYVLSSGSLMAFGDWLMVDPLAAIFVGLIGVVGCLTGCYSIGYIRHDVEHGELTVLKQKLYYGFFNLFLFTMLLVVTANNIVMMWVGIEATTLGSAFLVGIYGKGTSLEAAWKYLIICSVGVAFGLYGTVLTFANATASIDPHQAVLWTSIIAHAKDLDPTLVKIAFVFVLIGFGTKAGIFPMHAWLPDAHSEAPSPVSGLLSGVLLKCGLFVIIRYYAVTMKAIGPEFPQSILLVLGVLTVAISAFLVFVQHDFKRKLAYHSIEHVGLIVIGLGVGGPLGIAAALLHTINHSFTKALLFCGSGNVLQKYGTRDLRSVKGILRTAPVTGLFIMAGALALAGFPPFNVFVSEFMVFAAGLDAGYPKLMILVALLFTITVAALVDIIAHSVLGKAPENMEKSDSSWLSLAPMGALLALIMVFGVAMPRPVGDILRQATGIVMDHGTATATVTPIERVAVKK